MLGGANPVAGPFFNFSLPTPSGVVAVVAHNVRRRHDLAGDEVVGEIQQTAHEDLVTGNRFGLQGVEVAGRRSL